SAQFYKVTTENYHKAADQVNAKFSLKSFTVLAAKNTHNPSPLRIFHIVKSTVAGVMEQEESDSTSCLPITKQCQSLFWMNVVFKDVFDELEQLNRHYETYPVCADLQGQILACYKENVGKTLNCSNIATLYLQCVNNTKQNKLRTGG
ncbi:hypothetical protein JOQ06_003777, partial [Pogonophryne albipinna]